MIEEGKKDAPVIESALNEKWFEQFGHSDSETKAGNNFEGFELDEVWVINIAWCDGMIQYYYFV